MIESFLPLFEEIGLKVVLRLDDSALWEQTGLRLPYLPVAYSGAMINYQIVYWAGFASIAEISVIILHDNRPCGIWPLSLIKGNTGIKLGSNGGAILPPLFVKDTAAKTVKTITAQCLAFTGRAFERTSLAMWESAESFIDSVGLSDWHDRALHNDSSVKLQHELFVDLALDMAAIKSNFRKSYKSLISSGAKLWQVAVLDGTGLEIWDQFRLLHCAVAGRVTRSDESWASQYKAICSGDAFLIYLRDAEGRIVGGGLFHITRDEGLYAVAAYDRTLFDKPLGHVVQYRAIEEMKKRNVRWYKIGLRPYSAEVPTPSGKELAIADFKQGFATHLFPRYLIQHPVQMSTQELQCG